jgi:two-component system response regulator AtoC
MAAPSTILDRRTSSQTGGAAGFHLVVMGPAVFETLPLPATGELVIGRSRDADVALGDQLASRRHACLRVGAAFEIEDLDSANGTLLRGERLSPGRPVVLLPGEAVGIGTTVLMVQPARARPAPPRLHGHAEFEGRVEWECARAEATGGTFALARLHLDVDLAAARLAEAAAGVLRPLDVLAAYGPAEYELLFPGAGAAAVAVAVERLLAAVAEAGGRGRAGVACYPGDGVHAGALVAVACGRVKAKDGRGGSAGAAGGGAEADDASTEESMRRVHALCERAAAGSINVLILGETGVGKEVLARRLHRLSARAGKAFLAVNCAALSEALLESELFGHERGAFTGAGAAKPGLLESAPGGSLFLDEIGELPAGLQAKLLRVVEARELTRVGGVRPRPIDVRFIAATNRDLEAEVARAAFRRDLYFRLNGMTLTIPPLRERAGDVAALARRFVRELCARERREPAPRIDDEAMALMVGHAWPGNVRELRNVIERALLLAPGRVITPEHLPVERLAPLLAARESAAVAPVAPVAPGDAGRERVLAALAACAGNQSRAARALGISRKTLLARLDAYGVPRPRKGARS